MIALTYNGGGFLPDVPARDLTETEVEKLGGPERLIASGLYEVVPKKTKPKSRKTDRQTDYRDTP